MQIKRLFIVGMCCAAALSAFSCKKASGDRIKIGAIFAETGPASFLGAPEAKTARMVVEQINADGGISGRQVELIIKDSSGSPEKAISFAKQLIEEDKVFAIIGPSTSGETMSIKAICEMARTPLISCASAELIVNPLARYVFKTAQNDSFAAMRIFEVMKKKGITKVGVVSSNDGFGNAGKDQLAKIAPKYGITIVISEVYDKATTDLTGVLTKVKAKDVQAVINWSIVPAQSIVPKNMKQINLNVPLFQSHGFANIKYAKEAGEAGEGIIFPAGRILIAEQLPESHPQKTVLLKYKKDYEKKYGEDASTFGGHVVDALLILAETIKKVGADRDKVREAIENLKDLPGIGGVYTFSAQDHNGLGIDAFEMLTVRGGKFVLYKE